MSPIVRDNVGSGQRSCGFMAWGSITAARLREVACSPL